MCQITLTRRPAPAVHGSCRWLARPDARGYGRLAINGTPYAVAIASRVAYLAHEDGSGMTYRVDVTAGACECGDARNRSRPGGCKHVRSLRALLAKLDF